MRELRIDRVAGTFTIHRAEAAAFQKYLKTKGTGCDRAISESGAGWPEAPEGSFQQSDMVTMQPLHRERLSEVEELHQSWDSGGEGV